MATLTVAQPVITRRQLALTANGLITENFDRVNASANAILTAQRVTFLLVGFRAGDVVTNLHCILNTAGADAGGTGYAHMGLYNTGGTLLRDSVDARSIFLGSTGIVTVALASTYTILADGGYYIAVVTNFDTTQPKLASSQAVGGVAGISAAVGGGSNWVNVQTGQAVLPTPTASMSVSTSNPYWVGAS